MRSVLVSALLLLGCAAAFFGAGAGRLPWSVETGHAILSAVCVAFFLLGLVVAILSSTDRAGRLRAPGTLAALLCWTLALLQAGFATGRLTNHRASLEMALALAASPGASFVYAGDGVLLLDGEIGFDTFESLVRESALNEIRLVQLHSGGGLIESAARIGAFIADNDLATFVNSGCESACVIVALSSAKLYVTPDARFGFHRGSALANPDSELGRFVSGLATDDLIARLGALGVPEEILDRARNTPPDQMHHVSGEDLHRAGLADYLGD